MNRRAAFAIASALVLLLPGGGDAQVRISPGVSGYTPVVPPVLPQTITPLPQYTPPPTLPQGLPQLPSVQVVPPPKPDGKAEDADGGDCSCPAGQRLDADGWCWQATDADHGYWERTQQCE
jgi:hypothetical protein